MLRRYDVFHVHWPDAIVSSDSPWRARAYQMCFVVLLVRLRLTRTPVVRTMHNLAPHEPPRGSSALLIAWLERQAVARIYLNTSAPLHCKTINHVIPHGEYLSWYGRYPQVAAQQGRLACFGRIRAYKGVEALTEAFTLLTDDSLRLVLAGKPETEQLAESLQAAAYRDPRIELVLTMVSHEQLTTVVTESEIVVLPYRFYNSGAIMLAMSLGRPVIAAACPALDALAEECGSNWVVSYDPPLTAAKLEHAIADIRSAPRAALPPMVDRDWSAQARRLVDVYRTLTLTRSHPIT